MSTTRGRTEAEEAERLTINHLKDVSRRSTDLRIYEALGLNYVQGFNMSYEDFIKKLREEITKYDPKNFTPAMSTREKELRSEIYEKLTAYLKRAEPHGSKLFKDVQDAKIVQHIKRTMKAHRLLSNRDLAFEGISNLQELLPYLEKYKQVIKILKEREPQKPVALTSTQNTTPRTTSILANRNNAADNNNNNQTDFIDLNAAEKRTMRNLSDIREKLTPKAHQKISSIESLYSALGLTPVQGFNMSNEDLIKKIRQELDKYDPEMFSSTMSLVEKELRSELHNLLFSRLAYLDKDPESKNIEDAMLVLQAKRYMKADQQFKFSTASRLEGISNLQELALYLEKYKAEIQTLKKTTMSTASYYKPSEKSTAFTSAASNNNNINTAPKTQEEMRTLMQLQEVINQLKSIGGFYKVLGLTIVQGMQSSCENIIKKLREEISKYDPKNFTPAMSQEEKKQKNLIYNALIINGLTSLEGPQKKFLYDMNILTTLEDNIKSGKPAIEGVSSLEELAPYRACVRSQLQQIHRPLSASYSASSYTHDTSPTSGSTSTTTTTPSATTATSVNVPSSTTTTTTTTTTTPSIASASSSLSYNPMAAITRFKDGLASGDYITAINQYRGEPILNNASTLTDIINILHKTKLLFEPRNYHKKMTVKERKIRLEINDQLESLLQRLEVNAEEGTNIVDNKKPIQVKREKPDNSSGNDNEPDKRWACN